MTERLNFTSSKSSTILAFIFTFVLFYNLFYLIHSLSNFLIVTIGKIYLFSFSYIQPICISESMSEVESI